MEVGERDSISSLENPRGRRGIERERETKREKSGSKPTFQRGDQVRAQQQNKGKIGESLTDPVAIGDRQ